MCGISGLIHPSGETVPLELLQTITRTLRHRGPDAEGYYRAENVGLGFQRLSIIDLQGGSQPMSNEDGSLWLVFNGEIYNFRNLREQLEKTGKHRFKTHSDTEIILHLYEDYGERCVQFLRGMFAFALWNTKTKTLFMARDRFGKKPLVYANLPNVFLFASEIKALQKHPAIRKEIHYPAIDLYLSYQYIPSPWTIFQQIKKLPPAHTLTWNAGDIKIQRYWEPIFLPKTTLRFEEAGEQMMAKLREATQLRMAADVPVGAFLSGGIDSSVIVGLMSELSSKPIKTFSIGFEGDPASELPYAREVADRFQTDHYEYILKPNSIESLDTLVRSYGEPYADSSALPSYYLSQWARTQVKVCLNGDGGDEMMAGYPRYQAMAFMRFWGQMPISLRRFIFRTVSGLPEDDPPYSFIWRLKRLLRLGLGNPQTPYLDTLCYFHEDQKKDLYSNFFRDQLRQVSSPAYLDQLLVTAGNLPGIDRYLYVDLLSYLPEDLLVKMDIASMANSLEARSPFLDHEFAEWVNRFPPSWKLRGLFTTKYILRTQVQGWLPDSILRRRKQGFSAPLSLWFRGDLHRSMQDLLLSDRALSRKLFEKSAVRRLLEENSRGDRDHSYRLWALFVLEYWFRTCIDAPDP